MSAPYSGFVQVTKDAFFAFLKRDPRDIMPSQRDPHVTTWETRNREVVGRTLPGWKDGGDPNTVKTYMLLAEHAP